MSVGSMYKTVTTLQNNITLYQVVSRCITLFDQVYEQLRFQTKQFHIKSFWQGSISQAGLGSGSRRHRLTSGYVWGVPMTVGDCPLPLWSSVYTLRLILPCFVHSHSIFKFVAQYHHILRFNDVLSHHFLVKKQKHLLPNIPIVELLKSSPVFKSANLSWLVVSNMNFIVHFIYGMSSFPADELIFFKMVLAPSRYS